MQKIGCIAKCDCHYGETRYCSECELNVYPYYDCIHWQTDTYAIEIEE
jgi:hypothetical protein